MNRGILFEIPNEYGYHLQQILATIPVEQYYWRSGGEESYVVENGELVALLFEGDTPFTGKELREKIAQQHYLIFVNLKAFPTREAAREIETYEQFLTSDCVLIVLVIDSGHVAIFAKDQAVLQQLHAQVVASPYKMLDFITAENDGFERLTVF